MTHTSIHYEVKILGYIWWPNDVLCATGHNVYAPSELPREEDETDRDYEIRMVQDAAWPGDFSEIDAWEIERVVTTIADRREVHDWYNLLAFTDEQADQWAQCMYPEWIEENENA